MWVISLWPAPTVMTYSIQIKDMKSAAGGFTPTVLHADAGDFWECLRCRSQESNWTQDGFTITPCRGLVSAAYAHLYAHTYATNSLKQRCLRGRVWTEQDCLTFHWIIWTVLTSSSTTRRHHSYFFSPVRYMLSHFPSSLMGICFYPCEQDLTYYDRSLYTHRKSNRWMLITNKKSRQSLGQ